MNLSSFSVTVLSIMSRASNGLIGRVVDNVQPGTAHVVGIGSGVTGLALWSEVAKHLTAFVGLAVALAALAGGVFYALYWAVKALREYRELRRRPHNRRQ